MAVQVVQVETRHQLVLRVALEELAVRLAMAEKGVPFTPRRPQSLRTALSPEILPVELAQLAKAAMGVPEGWDRIVLMVPRLAMVEQVVMAVQEEEHYRLEAAEPFLLKQLLWRSADARSLKMQLAMVVPVDSVAMAEPAAMEVTPKVLAWVVPGVMVASAGGFMLAVVAARVVRSAIGIRR